MDLIAERAGGSGMVSSRINMNIRPATAQDVPAVLPMVSSICALHESWDPAKYGFLPDPAQKYRQWLSARAADPDSVFLVAQLPAPSAEGDVALSGFLIATVDREIPIYRIDRFGFIHDLWVEPAYRNEGIGRQLVMFAIERFAQLGVGQVRLDTAAANEPARQLFAACGFRISTIEMLLELQHRTAQTPPASPT
jgi:ribosomal protein S18 acetylase RimI-like enzyme